MPLADIVSKIFSGSAGDVIKNIGDVADKFITTPQEKKDFEEKVTEEINRRDEANLTQISTLAEQEEANVSDRWKNDMTSDSWLSKNARPITLMSILVAVFTFAFLSGLKINIDPSWVDLLKTWGMMVIGAYFGGRSLEKITKMKNP